MGIFAGMFGENRGDSETETEEQTLCRWRKELLKVLPELLHAPDSFSPSFDGQQINITHGSAQIIVDFAIDDEGYGYIVIDAPLVFLPKENLLPFYRRLLDINNTRLLLGGLSTEGNVAVLKRTIPIQGLDEHGFISNVLALCAEADELDDLLIREFGTRRFEFE